MIKYFVLLFNLIGLLIFNFFTNDVTVTMTVPQEVQAGSEFTVELVIVKGKVSGMGRFAQELQDGLTVSDKDAQFSNADFNFKYQKLRLMWLLLPADESITVKYTIQVDPNFKGKIKLSGQFVYMNGSDKMNADVAEQTINVVPGTGVVATNDNKTDSAKNADKSTISILPPDRNVSCIRQNPVKNETGDELIVKLDVTKDMASNYAKIEEEIPSGYIAEAIETKGAVFTFKDKKAKFLWMNLPAEGNFTISYKLKPEDKNVSLNNNISLKGFFSFLENEKTYSVDVKQTGEQIASKKDTTKTVVQKDPKTMTEAEKKKEAELKKEQEKKDLAAKKEQEKKDLALKKEEEKKEKQRKKDEAKQKEDERKKELAEKKKQQKNTNSQNTVPDPQKGVVYKVQLAAGHSPINVNYYFRNLKVTEKVATELHDGWRKYTIGAYPQYQAARDQRVYIWGNTPIGDAFVSAYNNGNRITVQEALMIVSQKWVK